MLKLSSPSIGLILILICLLFASSFGIRGALFRSGRSLGSLSSKLEPMEMMEPRRLYALYKNRVSYALPAEMTFPANQLVAVPAGNVADDGAEIRSIPNDFLRYHQTRSARAEYGGLAAEQSPQY